MQKQTRTFSLLKPKRADVFCLVFIVLTSIFVSCNESQKPPVESQVKFAVVKYDVKVIKKWLDDSTNKAFIFQFYTNKAKQSDSVWQALSYIIDSKGNYRNGFNPDTLRFDTKYNNDTAQFTGKIAVGNNVISAKKMNTILNQRPQNADAVFLVLVPVVNRNNRHVYYKIIVETSSMKLNDDGDDTNPCPPIDCYDDIE
jgi:hypothetical protein